MSQNRQNNKKNNESKEKKKKNIFKDILISIIVFIISGLLITYIYLIITGQTAIIDKIFAKVFKEEKSYSYTDYITDLNNDNVSIVDITSGSDKATVVLKSDEQKKIEKEIKEKIEKNPEFKDLSKEAKLSKIREEILKNREERKEELKKLKENNTSEYDKKLKEAKERTRKLNIPTLNSFSEFMQNKIAEGKNVEFVIKEIPAFTVVMSRIVALLPTIMFMILIYLTLKMYGTGKSRTSI
ncbi:MAG: hypothetical protein HXK70_05685 [Clostridiales bacterium]|nr:hypothetical protein [Clostridiales bacterium]